MWRWRLRERLNNMSEKHCPECGRDLSIPTTVCGRCGARAAVKLQAYVTEVFGNCFVQAITDNNRIIAMCTRRVDADMIRDALNLIVGFRIPSHLVEAFDDFVTASVAALDGRGDRSKWETDEREIVEWMESNKWKPSVARVSSGAAADRLRSDDAGPRPRHTGRAHRPASAKGQGCREARQP